MRAVGESSKNAAAEMEAAYQEAADKEAEMAADNEAEVDVVEADAVDMDTDDGANMFGSEINLPEIGGEGDDEALRARDRAAEQERVNERYLVLDNDLNEIFNAFRRAHSKYLGKAAAQKQLLLKLNSILQSYKQIEGKLDTSQNAKLKKHFRDIRKSDYWPAYLLKGDDLNQLNHQISQMGGGRRRKRTKKRKTHSRTKKRNTPKKRKTHSRTKKRKRRSRTRRRR